MNEDRGWWAYNYSLTFPLRDAQNMAYPLYTNAIQRRKLDVREHNNLFIYLLLTMEVRLISRVELVLSRSFLLHFGSLDTILNLIQAPSPLGFTFPMPISRNTILKTSTFVLQPTSLRGLFVVLFLSYNFTASDFLLRSEEITNGTPA